MTNALLEGVPRLHDFMVIHVHSIGGTERIYEHERKCAYAKYCYFLKEYSHNIQKIWAKSTHPHQKRHANGNGRNSMYKLSKQAT